MTLHDYLLKHLDYIAMISVSNHNVTKQYNYWNWFHEKGELHLLNNDMCIGHIIYTGTITENEDGSLIHTSKYFPKDSILNFYFDGVLK